MKAESIALFEERVRLACERRHIAGAVCMAANRETVIYEQAFGCRDLATDAPMTTDTVFGIASMTKPIVAAACMQLVEAGLLDLDADIGTLLPEYREPLVLEGFRADGVPQLRRAATPLTLRRVMAQTSGISDGCWDENRLRWSQRFNLPGLGPIARRMPLSFDPGTDWAYGIGMDLAMECLQAVTGETLESYLQAHVFGPLGMKSTSYRLSPTMAQRLAAVHFRDSGGPCISNTVLQLPTPAYGSDYDYGTGEGHGGLYSTAGDYLRFLRAVLRGGQLDGAQILRPESVDEMGRNQIGSLSVHFNWTGIDPGFSIDPELLLDGVRRQPPKWGLGWMLNETETAAGRRPGGMSWFGGYDTHMWLDRARGLCAVVMMQMRPSASAESLSLVYDFERLLNGHLEGGTT